MRTRAFSNDADTEGDSDSSDTGSADAGSSEFVFDGFKVMFVEKVMLTPVATLTPHAPLTQTQSRGWH